VDERELRAMIRESIARQMGGDDEAVRRSAFARASVASVGAHASHALLPLATGGDDDEGRCLIEPAVRCNHCGYCVSFGH
jgi:hypothetical protein